jgi:hypothetical protein
MDFVAITLGENTKNNFFVKKSMKGVSMQHQAG